MSEKLADDYGFKKLAADLAAHAYTGGDDGTFAVATDADLNVVLTTGEVSSNGVNMDLSDKASVLTTIGAQYAPAWPSHGICNDGHVPGNSSIFEYMVNTHDTNIGQNGGVSMASGACYVPYYLNAINKQIYKNNDYAAVTQSLNTAGTAITDSNYKTYYPKLKNVGYFILLFGSASAYITYLGGAS